MCREIKLWHGLTFGDSTGRKIQAERLRPEQRARLEIKTATLRAADEATSWAEFQYALETGGIETSFSFNRSTGTIRGVSFAKDGYRFARSKLSKQKLTYAKLAAKFGEIPVAKMATTDKVGAELLEKDKLASALSKSTKGIFDLLLEHDGELATPQKSKIPYNSQVPISMIPLSAIVSLLIGPGVVPSSGGGGTSNNLDWNDERRRRREAIENRHITKPSKRRR